MAEAGGLNLFTIPPNKGFADALADGLIARHGGDPLALARGLVLLPNNRAVRGLTDTFVRRSGGGLLLPRLVTIGDENLGEGIGLALDPADAAIPPAIEPMRRRMILARLIERVRSAQGQPVGADEAVRLAGDLGRVLDQMVIEGVDPVRLTTLELEGELSEHWTASLKILSVLTDLWPGILAERDRIDLQDRRNRQLMLVAERWRAAPPPGFVIAAGIGNSAPAAARLLRVIADMPNGQVVFAGLDLVMPDEEWDALGPHDPPARSIETHPQFHLKLLLDRMGAGRGEVAPWRGGGASTTPARSRAVANVLRPAAFTGKWIDEKTDRTLPGVAVAQFDTPAEEAQAIAIKLRGALEAPGRTAALVTPDRALARRVAAHVARWGVTIDDSAGQPLSQLASGTLLIALAEAAAQRFAPVALMALLKHPLVRAGEERLRWLDGARALDLALRGPRPAAGLDGVAAHLAEPRWRAAQIWWPEARALLEGIAAVFAGPPRPIAEMVAALRGAADTLSNGAVWANPQGRAAAEAIAAIEDAATDGPALIDPAAMAPLLRTLFGEVAVRPPQGGHPRLAIYGLVEARLQRADLMILGGLNEGVWPGLPAPDPWLAPRIRAELALPGLERRIGIEAHDFAMALGAEEVLVTRSARDASAPVSASRLWLRLQALIGDKLANDHDLARMARAIDDGGTPQPMQRPRPSPKVAERARVISVTEVDRLKADPFAFYARRMLGLNALDPVDADPSAAWRGTAVHDILEHWAKDDACDPARLRPRAEAMFRAAQVHPMLRALWQPRLMLAIDWIAEQIGVGGREVIGAEVKGSIEIAGVTLTGKFDRIDRMSGGGLAIIDYKTGEPPSIRSVAAGYSLQLGLIGLMAERGGFEGIAGTAEAFEYWSLARNKEGGFGKIVSPVEGRTDPIPADRFVALAAHNFTEAVGRWLTGGDAFTAKLHPEYAPYADYDQLMRRDEWFGRG